ncbi:MAG: alpha/beta hydrolase family protein [Dehalococcoidia bacterium]
MADEPISIPTARGEVAARFTAPAGDGDGPAVLLVGGADGGFDGPAEALYPTLAEDFAARGIATLRVDFRLHRFPNDVEEGVHDALAGLAWLEARGCRRVVLVGHSFGGAVVIEATARTSASPMVVGVVTLATQTAGAQRVDLVAPRPILLIHGRADTRLSPVCSQILYDAAGEPREIVILEGATHSLRQARAEVRTRVVDFACAALEA